jgi:glycosyltransferase involved in cell wall biosynthesis
MLKDYLSIVIPAKNEGNNLVECLRLLNRQAQIRGVKVFIADSSDEDQKPNIIDLPFKNLDIAMVLGGFPASARRNGSVYVETQYVLFLDADMMITERWLLYDVINAYHGDFDLLTVPFRTDPEWNWCYRIFDFTQWFSHKILKQPFAIGGFQLFEYKTYVDIGGYDSSQLFAEDYCISLKIKPERFLVHKSKKAVWTSPRRFQKKGIWYMVKVMYLAYINRNNPNFFKQSHGYWD